MTLIGNPALRELLRPFFDCRLCWRITLAVFGLILVVESVLLVPSAQRFERVEAQRLADHVQILVDPLLARAQASGTAPDLSLAIGQYGVRAVSVYRADRELIAQAGDAPPPFPAASSSMSEPVAELEEGRVLVAAWRSTYPAGGAVAVTVDASGIRGELLAYLLRIGGWVAIIVLVVTVGTMLVLDAAVLRPLLRLRESTLKAAAAPDAAIEFALATRRRDEMGEVIHAHNSMLEQIAASRERDRAIAEDRARFLTHHDALSGLPNRAALLEHLERELRSGGATLLLVNLVQFRAVNAGYGSGVGDRLICGLAARLKRIAAPGDFLAHLGADRLGLARSGILAPEAAADLAERLIRGLAEPFEFDAGVSISPPVRVGIAQSGAAMPDGQTLVAQADLALSRTYAGAELKYQFFSPALGSEARARQALARDLERALERRELFIVLQPKFRLAAEGANPLSGAEVLLRWRHPERGQVSPGEFIPVAEATGLIIQVGAFVLDAACEQARAWEARFGRTPSLAVNLSAQQFAQPDLLAASGRAIGRAGIPPGSIEYEITETAAMKDVERTAATLAAMRELGVRVAIDDFGTGYSSLNYLRRFAVDAIKIDKSFVDDIGSDRNAEAICDAILRLGQSLGTRVVAEGVETEEQAAFLRRRRCDEVQGYLFGRPVPYDEFERLYLGERLAATSAA